MKKTALFGIALTVLLVTPPVFAAGAGNGAQDSAGMQQGQRSMAHKAMKKTMRHRMSTEDVKAIQGALNGHGAKLAVDGKWGKDTREAIKAFQKENGLKATGYANKKTRVKLGLKF